MLSILLETQFDSSVEIDELYLMNLMFIYRFPAAHNICHLNLRYTLYTRKFNNIITHRI